MSFKVECPECGEDIWANRLAYHALNNHRDSAVETYDKLEAESKKILDRINEDYRKWREEEKRQRIKEIEDEYKI